VRSNLKQSVSPAVVAVAVVVVLAIVGFVGFKMFGGKGGNSDTPAMRAKYEKMYGPNAGKPLYDPGAAGGSPAGGNGSGVTGPGANRMGRPGGGGIGVPRG